MAKQTEPHIEEAAADMRSKRCSDEEQGQQPKSEEVASQITNAELMRLWNDYTARASGDMSDEEAMELALEAVAWARAQIRAEEAAREHLTPGDAEASSNSERSSSGGRLRTWNLGLGTKQITRDDAYDDTALPEDDASNRS